MKFSDSFKSLESFGFTEKDIPSLELIVEIIDINEGKNSEIVNKCRTLAQYSAFIAKVRELENEGSSQSEAIKKAIYYCRNHDILKEFLKKNASEVMNMLMGEWNLDDALAVRYKEGIEIGAEKERQRSNKEKLGIARNALAKGIPIDVIHEITGLDINAIKNL